MREAHAIVRPGMSGTVVGDQAKTISKRAQNSGKTKLNPGYVALSFERSQVLRGSRFVTGIEAHGSYPTRPGDITGLQICQCSGLVRTLHAWEQRSGVELWTSITRNYRTPQPRRETRTHSFFAPSRSLFTLLPHPLDDRWQPQ